MATPAAFMSIIVTASTGQATASLAQLNGQMAATSKSASKNSALMGTAMKAGAKTGALAIAAVGAASVVAAAKFESSFAEVRKTVDASEAKFKQLETQLRNLAKEIPVSVNELNELAGQAGALGIKADDLVKFTKTAAELGIATDLSADQAANALARLSNIMGTSAKDFRRLGSTMVELGNEGASTESEIAEMALRISGAGNQVGLTEAQVLSFASALSSVGVRAESGGSAISRAFIQMAGAVDGSEEGIKTFAETAGMSVDEFSTLFEKNAAKAMISFMEGLEDVRKEGGSVFQTLEDLGLSEIRVRDAMLRASGAGKLFREQLKIGSDEWKRNNALTEEAERRYETTSAKFQVFKNRVNDLFITIGQALDPAVKSLLDSVNSLIGGKGAGFEAVKGVVDDVIGSLREFWEESAIVRETVKALWVVIQRTAENAFDGLKQAFEGVISSVRGVVKIISGILTLDFGRALDGVKDVFGGLFDSTVGFAKMMLSPLTGTFEAIANAIKKPVSDAFHAIVGAAKTAWGAVTDVVETAWNVIMALSAPQRKALEAIFTGVKAVAKAAWAGIKLYAKIFWAWLMTITFPVRKALEFFFKHIETIAKAAWDVIKFAAKLFWNWLMAVTLPARKLIVGAFNLIKTVGAAIWNKIKGPAKDVFDWLVGAAEDVARWVVNAFEDLKQGMKMVADDIADFFTNAIDTIIGGFTTMLDAAEKWADVMSKAPGPLGDAFDDLQTAIGNSKDEIDRFREGLRSPEELVEMLDIPLRKAQKLANFMDENPGLGAEEALSRMNMIAKETSRNFAERMGLTQKAAKTLKDYMDKHPGLGAKEALAKMNEAGEKTKDKFPKSLRDAMKEANKAVDKGGKEIHGSIEKQLTHFGIKGPDARQIMVSRPGGPSGPGHHTAQRGGYLNMGAPSGDSIPLMAERGEYVLNRKAVARIGKSALDQVNFDIAPRMQAGGMVDPAGPGTGVVNPAIAGVVGRWSKQYDAAINYGYDPGGGHVSPGHNVTGTATDTGPAAGWTSSATALFERGLRSILGSVDQILYGTAGIGTPYPNHGRGNHAHIEWGSHPDAVLGLEAAFHLPRFKGKFVQGKMGAIGLNKEAAALEKIMARRVGLMGGGPDAGPMAALGQYSVTDMSNLWSRTGGPGGQSHVAGAVGMAESGGDPRAVGPPTSYGQAKGLWQILGQVVDGDIFNPSVNAQNAIKKYQDASGWSPWEAYTNGAYQRFMREGGEVGKDGKKKPIEKITIDDLERMFGFGHKRIRQIIGSAGFPKPVDRRGGHPIYSLSAVEKWAKETDHDIKTSGEGFPGWNAVKKGKNLREKLQKHMKTIAKLDESIGLAESMAGAVTGPGGTELTQREKDKQVRLTQKLFGHLKDAAHISKVGTRITEHGLERKNAPKQHMQALKNMKTVFKETLLEMTGLTGRGGRVFETGLALRELKAVQAAGTMGLSIEDLEQLREAFDLGLFPVGHGGGKFVAPAGQQEGGAILQQGETVLPAGATTIIYSDVYVGSERIAEKVRHEIREVSLETHRAAKTGRLPS